MHLSKIKKFKKIATVVSKQNMDILAKIGDGGRKGAPIIFLLMYY